MARRQKTIGEMLGIGDDPVQPSAFSRSNFQLRPAPVSGGGWTPAVPGTLAASETNLGRMASALSETGGLIGDVAALNAKKAELEEKGLAITHQTAMAHMSGQIADERLKQLSMKLDMAEQLTNEAIVRENWQTMSPTEQAAAVKESADRVASANNARVEALGAIAKENAGMDLEDLPPENRSVHHELMRGTAASRLFGPALKKHLIDWTKEKGEKGEFITKGSEDFDQRVLAFVKQHKEENEIIEGTPADDNYNRGLRAYYDGVLPSQKEAFLEANRKANLNNELRLAAFTATSHPAADANNPEKQQELIQTTVWKNFSGKKNNDEFDMGMLNLVNSLIKENSHEALHAARNWLNLSDADPDHDYRGGKFSESNPYKQMMALIAAAEEKLDNQEVQRANAKVAALQERLEGSIIQQVYSGNADSDAVANFGQRLATDVSNATVSTLIGLVGENSDVGRELADLGWDERRKLNNGIISQLPSIQQNARLGGSQFTQSILGDASFSFSQATQTDVGIILKALPTKGGHERLQEAFGSKGETIGEYDLTRKTKSLLVPGALDPTEIDRVNFRTEADAKAMRLRLAQKVHDDFVNDPANPNNQPPTKEEMRRLLIEEHLNIKKAWPVIWAGHAQTLLDEKAHDAKMEEQALQAEHAERQLQELEEDKTPERDPQFAWDLVRLARPLEQKDDESLKNLTPGTPEFDIAAKKLSDAQRERGVAFQKRWENESKLMAVREAAAREEVVKLRKEAQTGYGKRGGREGQFLTPKHRLKSREQALEATKPHAEAFRNRLGYGMEYQKINNLVKTGFSRGKEHGVGFIAALHEDTVGDESFNPLRVSNETMENRTRNKDDIDFGVSSEMDPKTAATLQERVDGFIPMDTFSVVLPPITDLPPSGAIRTETGKVSSIDLAAVRATLEASDADLFKLATVYGFAEDARWIREGGRTTVSPAEHQRIITKFLTHQYNTPYHRSKYSTSK